MKEPVQSQADLEKLLAEGKLEPKPVNAPAFYVTSIRTMFEPTGVSIIFSRSQPTDIPHGTQVVHASAIVPAAIIDMSPQTAKDLFVLLQEQIEGYEKSWGTIETEFTRRRANKK